MPYGIGADSTMPYVKKTATTAQNSVIFLAAPPDYGNEGSPGDFLIGGGVLDNTLFATKYVPAGSVVKQATAGGKFGPVAPNDDGTAVTYALLLHDRDVTTRDAAFEPLTRSRFVIKDLLPAAIPAAVLALRDFRYHAVAKVEYDASRP